MGSCRNHGECAALLTPSPRPTTGSHLSRGCSKPHSTGGGGVETQGKECSDLRLFPTPTQEAYSMARQFNLIPPVCEQAEHRLFQREKVQVQLPELYHKIGSQPPIPACPLA